MQLINQVNPVIGGEAVSEAAKALEHLPPKSNEAVRGKVHLNRCKCPRLSAEWIPGQTYYVLNSNWCQVRSSLTPRTGKLGRWGLQKFCDLVKVEPEGSEVTEKGNELANLPFESLLCGVGVFTDFFTNGFNLPFTWNVLGLSYGFKDLVYLSQNRIHHD